MTPPNSKLSEEQLDALERMIVRKLALYDHEYDRLVGVESNEMTSLISELRQLRAENARIRDAACAFICEVRHEANQLQMDETWKETGDTMQEEVARMIAALESPDVP